ncbi:MAG: Cys-tRNA(Pro) deacylase [Bdellovibrionales bacterium]
MKVDVKTNAMRILDKLKIKHKTYSYADTDAISGVEIAAALGQDPAHVFKTLVTVGKSKKYYVFMIPVAAELDLKKAAHSVGEKAVEMIKQKELFPLTGYVHGGCSPIGMKKVFTTRIHETAGAFDSVVFSAGKIGYQIETPLADLQKAVELEMADLVKA